MSYGNTINWTTSLLETYLLPSSWSDEWWRIKNIECYHTTAIQHQCKQKDKQRNLKQAIYQTNPSGQSGTVGQKLMSEESGLSKYVDDDSLIVSLSFG